ncbi:MAG: exonuclease domain-containing protein [Oscillospiraceae bacterium]|nr:exonuclease domain-containing protein [Oscillospiraceae bacterium]
MNYIVMDLEWNNAYLKSAHSFVNEIIEVGAVKLNEKLEMIDTFSQFICPVASKKIRARIKELTHIENDDLVNANPFKTVMADFADWCGEDFAILTWGDSDIRTLVSNYKYFGKLHDVFFIERYADIQKYCQEFINMENVQQAGLSYAAECLEINSDDFPHHRALDDSLLSSECLIKTFDAEKISKYIKVCNGEFFEKLSFKPYYINNRNDPSVDQSVFNEFCDICGGSVQKLKNWKYMNHSFRAVFYCEHCDRQFRVNVRIKKLYDRVDVKRNTVEIVKTGKETE